MYLYFAFVSDMKNIFPSRCMMLIIFIPPVDSSTCSWFALGVKGCEHKHVSLHVKPMGLHVKHVGLHIV